MYTILLYSKLSIIFNPYLNKLFAFLPFFFVLIGHKQSRYTGIRRETSSLSAKFKAFLCFPFKSVQQERTICVNNRSSSWLAVFRIITVIGFLTDSPPQLHSESFPGIFYFSFFVFPASKIRVLSFHNIFSISAFISLIAVDSTFIFFSSNSLAASTAFSHCPVSW